jgi:hypothetical protein
MDITRQLATRHLIARHTKTGRATHPISCPFPMPSGIEQDLRRLLPVAFHDVEDFFLSGIDGYYPLVFLVAT